ncbi:MAG: flagellar motor switch protein FliG [Hyphomicrobiales bacterium]|nr:flagellar motor switch protein FliG [Hyphomicrobiales bacterium]
MTVQAERRSGQERRRLSGAHRAAALLLTMGQDSASRLLKHLETDDVRQIMKAAATLGIVDAQAIAGIIDQFVSELAEGPKLIGDVAQAQALGASSLSPEEVSDIITSFSEPAKVDVWAQFTGCADTQIVALVEGERSVIAAVLLGKLDPARAASVCAMLGEKQRADILSGLYAMRPLTPFAENCLEQALEPVLAVAPAAQDGEKPEVRVASIVNRLEPDAIESVLKLIGEKEQAQADAVRGLIFTFDDVAALSAEATSALFDQTPTERVILALQGAEPAIVEKVLGCLGARARRMVESELASGQAAVARDVSAARRFIAETALKLAQAGTIELPGAKPQQPHA